MNDIENLDNIEIEEIIAALKGKYFDEIYHVVTTKTDNVCFVVDGNVECEPTDVWVSTVVNLYRNAKQTEEKAKQKEQSRRDQTVGTLEKVYKATQEFFVDFQAEGWNEDPLFYCDINDISCMNLYVSRYLRSKHYGGTAWNTLCGYRPEELTNYLEEAAVISPDEYKVVTKDITMEGTHLMGALNAYLYESPIELGLFAGETIIDGYTGWAGDLLQLGRTIKRYADENGIDLSRSELTRNFLVDAVGCTWQKMENKYSQHKLYVDGSEYGFSKEDLIQDADAFNMYVMYDWSKMTMPEIFQSYYFDDQYYKYRYTYFKKHLLAKYQEVDAKYCTLSRIASIYVDSSVSFVLGAAFEYRFGDWDGGDAFRENLCYGFAEKLTQLCREESGQ